MTTVAPTISPPAGTAIGPSPGPGGGLVWLTKDTWVLTRRSLPVSASSPRP
jgi:hypothetical protein